MTDIDLLVLGCGVSFITVGGFYVYLRERYQEHQERAPVERKRARDEAKRRAA